MDLAGGPMLHHANPAPVPDSGHADRTLQPAACDPQNSHKVYTLFSSPAFFLTVLLIQCELNGTWVLKKQAATSINFIDSD